MKHLQTFSKYFIYITLLGIPLLWSLAIHYDFFYSEVMFHQSFIALMWHTTWISLLFVMAIRPLSIIFPGIQLLKKLIFLRKAFGILSATIVITNLVASGFTQTGFLANYFSLPKWELGYSILARISELTALILLATSNLYSVKKLGKNWKKIQKLTYLYFLSGGLVAAQYQPEWYYGSMLAIGGLYIGVIIKSIYGNKKS